MNRRPGLQTRRPSGSRGKKPTISALGASSGERWFASTSMSITGNNLGAGATVNFGATTGIATTYTAGNGTLGTLAFDVPESEFWETGTRNVTVTYNGSTSSTLIFSVVQPVAMIQDLRADRGITLNGSTVSSWASSDTSGDANRTVSQATAGLQPTYRSSDADFNNRPSVKFVRANATKLVSGTFNTGTWAQTSIAAVLKSVASNSNGYYISDGLNSTDRTMLADYFLTINALVAYRASGQAELAAYNNANVRTPSVIFAQFEGSIGGATTENLFVRSASTGSSGTYGSNPGQTGVTIGDRFAPYTAGGNGSFDGAVAEWIMFNTPLTQDQRSRLGNYFSNRYGSGVMTL